MEYKSYQEFREAFRNSSRRWVVRAKEFLPPEEYATLLEILLPLEQQKADAKGKGLAPPSDIQTKIRSLCQQALEEYGHRKYPTSSNALTSAAMGGNSSGSNDAGPSQGQQPPVAAGASSLGPTPIVQPGPSNPTVQQPPPTAGQTKLVLPGVGRSKPTPPPNLAGASGSRSHPGPQSSQGLSNIRAGAPLPGPAPTMKPRAQGARARALDSVGGQSLPQGTTRTQVPQSLPGPSGSRLRSVASWSDVLPPDGGPYGLWPPLSASGSVSNSGQILSGVLTSLVSFTSLGSSLNQANVGPVAGGSGMSSNKRPRLDGSHQQASSGGQNPTAAVHLYLPWKRLVVSEVPGVTYADFSRPGTAVAFMVEYVFVENGCEVPAFRSWHHLLDQYSSKVLTADLIRALPDIDPVALLEFAEKHGGSSIPSIAEGNEALAGSVAIKKKKTPIFLEEVKNTVWQREDSPQAWLFSKYERGKDDDVQAETPRYLLSGLFNDLTFGTCASMVLEWAFAKSEQAIVEFDGLGLEKFVVDLSLLTMVDKSTNVEWNLVRTPVQYRSTIPPPSVPIPEVELCPPGFIVPIDWLEFEFKDLIPARILHKGVMKHITVIKTYEVVNISLRKNFMEAGAELRKTYSLPAIRPMAQELQQKLVFHGTTSVALESICCKNFDWRIAGSKTGAVYGDGTYFGPRFADSYVYASKCESSTRRSGNRRKFMLLADIYVGQCQVGYQGLRCPEAWHNGVRYDTIVDNEAAPTMYVKFDSNQTLPRYILEFESK